jgi:hypothetical protein
MVAQMMQIIGLGFESGSYLAHGNLSVLRCITTWDGLVPCDGPQVEAEVQKIHKNPENI